MLVHSAPRVMCTSACNACCMQLLPLSEHSQRHAKLKQTGSSTTGVIASLAAVLKLGRPESTFPVALRVMAWVPPLFDDGTRLSSTARRLLVKLVTRTILALCPAAQPGSKASIPPAAAVICQPHHLQQQPLGVYLLSARPVKSCLHSHPLPHLTAAAITAPQVEYLFLQSSDQQV